MELVTSELPKLKGRNHLEDPFVDGKLIFFTLTNWDRSVWTGLSRLKLVVSIV